MRQGKWVEYLKEFDFEHKYHPRKENKVVDALSIEKLYVANLIALNLNC